MSKFVKSGVGSNAEKGHKMSLFGGRVWLIAALTLPFTAVAGIQPLPLGTSPRDPAIAGNLMNHYRVATEYGQFEVHGDAMLRRLRAELRAINTLRQMSRGVTFGESLKDAVTGPFRGARELISQPAKTLSTVSGSLARIPGRTRAAVEGSTSIYEDNMAEGFLLVSQHKREHADALGVDVYSRNKVLQKELNSVAWSEAAAGLGVSVGIAVATFGGSIATSNLSRVSDLRDIMRTRSAAELRMDTREALNQMVTNKLLIKRFLDHFWYSPRHEFMIASSLLALEGADGREQFVERALDARSEETALAFQQMAEMMRGYHRTVAPIKRVSVIFGIPLVRDGKDQVAVLLPFDHCQWTARVAEVAAHVAAQIKSEHNRKTLTLWTPGTVTPRAREGFAALGIQVHQRSDAVLPLLD